MDLERVRRLIIAAIASNDELMERLVLKGGNALAIVYGIGNRASLDIDFSMAKDFSDLTTVKSQLFSALSDRFHSEGLVLFDEKIKPIPSENWRDATWGGYKVTFKLISEEKYLSLSGDLQALQRQAMTIGTATQKRTFSVEISKHEYVTGRIEAEVDDYVCYVYTLPMIVAEKLRAICQQMPEYKLRRHPAPRARDFYDIWAVITQRRVDLSSDEFHNLMRNIFAAKAVPLYLLVGIPGTKEFHAQDWPAVKDSIFENRRDFEYYFNFVIAKLKTLEPLWIE